MRHSEVEVDWLGSESQAGCPYDGVYPQFLNQIPRGVNILVPESEVRDTIPDLVFSCLPHGASARLIAPFLKNGKTRVIDLSADFRIRDKIAYEKAYGSHGLPEWADKGEYGLCELNRQAIKNTRLLANPGCYPTSVLLPLIPLLRGGIIAASGIIVDAKSGVSGAGKKATDTTHYLNCNESVAAYKVGDQHRHLAEMEEQLALASGEKVSLLFTPHLMPMERGILSTIYCDLSSGKGEDEAEACLAKAYSQEPFVHLRSDFPRTGDVSNTNHCHIKAYQPKGSRKLILVSVIDNMVKGASGQALQNMNLMFGLNPVTGLL